MAQGREFYFVACFSLGALKPITKISVLSRLSCKKCSDIQAQIFKKIIKKAHQLVLCHRRFTNTTLNVICIDTERDDMSPNDPTKGYIQIKK